MNTALSITNPYAAPLVAPAIEIQLLLAAGVVCMAAGLLLAEQKTLRRVIGAIDNAFDLVSSARRAGESA